MFKGTTIIAVRHNGKVVMAGDGQVTFGDSIIKHTAKKVRRLYNDTILAGFAGSTADAFTLFDRFGTKLEENRGNLMKSAVQLAKDWRTDKILHRLEALLIVADKSLSLLLSGTGDIIEPDDNIITIGSGGNYALAAARAMVQFTNLDAKAIAENALKIASDICIYTNNNIITEEL